MYVTVFEYRNGTPDSSTMVTYRAIRNLKFMPEIDMTLSTIPVNEFEVEIITDDSIPVNNGIRLYDDNNTLFADYRVMKSERGTGRSRRILAQSYIALMDRWTLKATYIQSTGLQWILDNMLYGSRYVKSGKVYDDIVLLAPSGYGNVRVTGFFPEQTARQRLQWICLAFGFIVRQSFRTGLALVPVANLTQATPVLIPYEDTFYKPEVADIEPAHSLVVSTYGDWTLTEDPDDPNQQSGVDEISGLKEYWSVGQSWTYVNSESEYGPDVTIDGVTIIDSGQGDDVLNAVIRAYFASQEWTVDCINNGSYYPGMRVNFYTEDAIRQGIIKSCDFSFGVQARAKLVIDTDVIYPLSSGYVTVHYVHSYTDNGVSRTMALGYNGYQFPEGATVTIKHPPVYVDVVGEVRVFQPAVASTTLTLEDTETEITIQYS